MSNCIAEQRPNLSLFGNDDGAEHTTFKQEPNQKLSKNSRKRGKRQAKKQQNQSFGAIVGRTQVKTFIQNFHQRNYSSPVTQLQIKQQYNFGNDKRANYMILQHQQNLNFEVNNWNVKPLEEKKKKMPSEKQLRKQSQFGILMRKPKRNGIVFKRCRFVKTNTPKEGFDLLENTGLKLIFRLKKITETNKFNEIEKSKTVDKIDEVKIDKFENVINKRNKKKFKKRTNEINENIKPLIEEEIKHKKLDKKKQQKLEENRLQKLLRQFWWLRKNWIKRPKNRQSKRINDKEDKIFKENKIINEDNQRKQKQKKIKIKKMTTKETIYKIIN